MARRVLNQRLNMTATEALRRGLVRRTNADYVCGEISPESRRDGSRGPRVICELEPGHEGDFHIGTPDHTTVVWARLEDETITLADPASDDTVTITGPRRLIEGMLTEEQKADARAAGRTDLEHRWNLAAARAGFAGSEYVDEPEFVFQRVLDRLEVRLGGKRWS